MSRALERRKKIMELAFAGLNRSEIATKVGCSLGAVNRFFLDFGLWPEDFKIANTIKNSSGHGPPQ